MSVMLLPLTWVILLMIGFTMMFWGVSEPSLGTAISLSGAAITTEGFLAPKGAAQITLYIIGGIIGLGIVGLLITFLPTVYSIYSQREEEVTRVAFRFGVPPSGVKVLAQSYRLGWLRNWTSSGTPGRSGSPIWLRHISPIVMSSSIARPSLALRGLPQQALFWMQARSFLPLSIGRMCPG